MKKKYLIGIVLMLIWPGFLPAPDLQQGGDSFSFLEQIRTEVLKRDQQFYHNNYSRFKNLIARYESRDNWKEYNRFGFIGKYQFGRSALAATGYSHVTLEGFKVEPGIFSESDQEKAMDLLLKINESAMNDHIRQYVGFTIRDSILITRTGILAAAHLSGTANVKEFLETDGVRNPKDRMGTRLSDYLYYFSRL